jgi:murein DD-endopeptidase MepM/ murein hydrolase activator NlpD
MARQRGSAAARRGRTSADAGGRRRTGSALRRAPLTVTALVVGASLALAGSAAGQSTGGASPQAAPPPLSDVPFGVVVQPRSEVRSLACIRDCASPGTVHVGSRLRLRGRRLARTFEVVFLGAEGEADDVATAPLKPKRSHRVDVLVPLGAVSGPVVVADRDGQRSEAVAGPAIAAPDPSLLAGGPPRVELQVQARRAFFDAEQPAEVTYVVHGDSPADVVVELVRGRDGALVARWDVPAVPPGVLQTLTWDGTAGGAVQRAGRYSFRVSAITAGGARAVSAQAPETVGVPDPAAFEFLSHEFPVRGPHGYGEFAASFGGGRGHQGQDVFAACGTPLVAARGGVVKFEQYHARAGHYIVIDGERTGVDYAYMHLRDAALVDVGDRVRTGQLVGYVGDTGSASACHLHFEMWRSPGWYDGGAPFDPLPSLQSWDRRS